VLIETFITPSVENARNQPIRIVFRITHRLVTVLAKKTQRAGFGRVHLRILFKEIDGHVSCRSREAAGNITKVCGKYLLRLRLAEMDDFGFWREKSTNELSNRTI
jgi:hypothetical protein